VELIDAIYQRRSIKHYDKNHVLTKDEEQKLLEATIQAPSSFNIQHWRFVLLRDPDLRERIREEYAGGQAQIVEASLLVLFTADVNAWQKETAKNWENVPREVAESMVRGMVPFHERRGERFQRDEAQRSIGMAMQTLMLAALDMGYQSCPIIGYDQEGVAKLINLPEDHVIGPMVAVGKGLKEPWTKPNRLPLADIVYENAFESP
jgi:nitroreductase